MSDRPDTSPESLLAHAAWVRALARALVVDPCLADDIEQQAWVRALEARRDEVRRPREWLSGIVRNVRREMARGEARRGAREEAAARPEALPPAEELLERAELQTKVARAVLELDEPYRSTLLLRYFEELAPDQIARRLGLPGSTIRSRLGRALARLRERFDRENADRRTWVRALVPLALGMGSEDPTPPATGGSPTRPPLLGGTSMVLVKGLVAAGLVLAAAGGVKLGFDGLHGREERRTGELAREERSGAPAEAVARAALVPGGFARDDPSRRTPAAETPAALPPAGGPAPTISGRVVDTQGEPVAGAVVFVGGRPGPFETPTTLLATGEDRVLGYDPGQLEHVERFQPELKGRLAAGIAFLTTAEGAFRASPPEGSRVYVAALSTVGLRATRSGVWCVAPAEGLDFTLERVPTASLAISVRNAASGERLPRFEAEVARDGEPPTRVRADQPLVTLPVELPPGGLQRFRIRVLEPAWARTSAEVDATPDRTIDVELAADPGLGLRGLVVDASGAPVADALVFWGGVEQLRPDPLGPFEPEHALGGVRTDAQGWFQLPGEEDAASAARTTVTVWHERHSPATVAGSDATLIRMPPRGSIRGRLLDDRGGPLGGVRLHLDRERSATTDSDGRFVFEDVVAGLHGLLAGLESGRWYVGVCVEAGRELAFERAPGVETSIELQRGGEPFTERVGGVVIGLANPFPIAAWDADGGTATRDDLPRGPCLLLSASGLIAAVDIRESRSVADVGASDLTIEARPGARVSLVPEAYATSAAVRLVLAHTARTVPASGELSYVPLRDGRYRVFVAGDPAVRFVIVDGPGSRATLLR
jgi:RNA polymerase sigma factor (sigma-70 family)